MDSEISYLWKSYCVILEMLSDRRFIVPEGYDLSLEQFIEWVGDVPSNARKEMTLTFEKEKASLAGSSIAIFWKDSIGTMEVREIVETLEDLEITNAIVVYSSKVTPYAKSAIGALLGKNIILEPFIEAELQYNVTKHVDVPRHIICSAAKKAQIFKAYSVKKDQLPQIKAIDPQCRYLGARRGQLIKIVRPSESIEGVMVDGERKKLWDISFRIVV